VVHPELRLRSAGSSSRAPEARLAEAEALTGTLGLPILHAAVVPVPRVDPATLFGSGKVEEIAGLAAALNPEVAVVDGHLSPIQQRNLERAWKTKVIDRTGLILEIFASRARTREGRLQVALAQATYQKGRLVRAWTHLERQRGGRGFLAGPGETQMEADRRKLDERIMKIRGELDTVKRRRELQRSARRRVPYPVVALVGYTNAGKSTLFNALTRAGVLAEDKLFATLDPTLRAIVLPGGRRIILSDTVGFISDLPTQLVAAFRATLEEVLQADILLHVRDAASPETEAQKADVLGVLDDLGIGENAAERIVEVLNKADLLPPAAIEKLVQAEARPAALGTPTAVVSALTGQGLDRLLTLIAERLAEDDPVFDVRVPPGDGEGLAWCYGHGAVLARRDRQDGSVALKVAIRPRYADALRARFQTKATERRQLS